MTDVRLFGALAICLLAPATMMAEEDAPAATSPDDDPIEIKVNGAYSFWGLNQNNFLLGRQVEGKDHPLDDAAYVVQNFRLGLNVGKKNVGGKMRLDAAQGW